MRGKGARIDCMRFRVGVGVRFRVKVRVRVRVRVSVRGQVRPPAAATPGWA